MLAGPFSTGSPQKVVSKNSRNHGYYKDLNRHVMPCPISSTAKPIPEYAVSRFLLSSFEGLHQRRSFVLGSAEMKLHCFSRRKKSGLAIYLENVYATCTEGGPPSAPLLATWQSRRMGRIGHTVQEGA